MEFLEKLRRRLAVARIDNRVIEVVLDRLAKGESLPRVAFFVKLGHGPPLLDYVEKMVRYRCSLLPSKKIEGAALDKAKKAAALDKVEKGMEKLMVKGIDETFLKRLNSEISSATNTAPESLPPKPRGYHRVGGRSNGVRYR